MADETQRPAAAPVRVALVVQRYGDEINGGAELLARMIAERLAQRYRVDVLTSCALDYTTWAMHYAPGRSVIDGVTVLRFAHPPRAEPGPGRIRKPHRIRFRLRRLLRLLPGGAVARPEGDDLGDGVEFLRRQGPHSEDLLRYIAEHRADYDAGIFVTAQYEPAAAGVLAWGPGSILVPTLHDEKTMYLPHFRRVFHAAERIFYLTAPEQRLGSWLYGLPPGHGKVVGVGIDAQQPSPEQRRDALQRHGLPRRYLVYVGRIDVAKGCRELIDAFVGRAAGEPDLALVLVGQPFMQWTPHPRIVATGFVSDADRNAIVAGSLGLVLPSRYESLSMVLLEAMALGIPVLANARCEVLADHVQRSGGGMLYRSARRLGTALLQLARMSDVERQRLGAAGRAYVAGHYTWPRVMACYHDAIERFAARSRAAAAQPAPPATASIASSQPRCTTAGP